MPCSLSFGPLDTAPNAALIWVNVTTAFTTIFESFAGVSALSFLPDFFGLRDKTMAPSSISPKRRKWPASAEGVSRAGYFARGNLTRIVVSYGPREGGASASSIDGCGSASTRVFRNLALSRSSSSLSFSSRSRLPASFTRSFSPSLAALSFSLSRRVRLNSRSRTSSSVTRFLRLASYAA